MPMSKKVIELDDKMTEIGDEVSAQGGDIQHLVSRMTQLENELREAKRARLWQQPLPPQPQPPQPQTQMPQPQASAPQASAPQMLVQTGSSVRSRKVRTQKTDGRTYYRLRPIDLQLKDCDGSGICEHQRIRSTCKDCGGSGICEHQRRRNLCKECRARAADADESLPPVLEEL